VKRSKAGPIGVVIGDDTVRAAQQVDGEYVFASVPIEDDLKKAVKLVLQSSPFEGRDVALGLEGASVLIESLVIPPGAGKPAAQAAERLKGDPLFDADKAVHRIAIPRMPEDHDPAAEQIGLVGAIQRERLDEVMKVCRDADLAVQSVEVAALALWRAHRAEGLEARLVRAEQRDVILVGRDDTLMFARVVQGTVTVGELATTLSRAASLLRAESFPRLKSFGLEQERIQGLSEALAMPVIDMGGEVAHPYAAGVCTGGDVLCDFLPPEEREIREKRRLRKVRMTVGAGIAAVMAVAGVLGWQDLEALEVEKSNLEDQVALMDVTQAEYAQLQQEIARFEANDALLLSVRPGHRVAKLFELLANSSSEDILVETINVQDMVHPSAEGGSSNQRVCEVRIHGVATDEAVVREFRSVLYDTGAFRDIRIDAIERVLLGVGVEGDRFRMLATAETH